MAGGNRQRELAAVPVATTHLRGNANSEAELKQPRMAGHGSGPDRHRPDRAASIGLMLAVFVDELKVELGRPSAIDTRYAGDQNPGPARPGVEPLRKDFGLKANDRRQGA